MKDNRHYINYWKTAPIEYELSHMIDSIKEDTIEAVLALYKVKKRPSKEQVRKLLTRNSTLCHSESEEVL